MFANLAEAVAEGRGKAQAETRRASLRLTPREVERHLANIYTKIGATGRTARATATAFAHRNKVTQPEPARSVG